MGARRLGLKKKVAQDQGNHRRRLLNETRLQVRKEKTQATHYRLRGITLLPPNNNVRARRPPRSLQDDGQIIPRTLQALKTCRGIDALPHLRVLRLLVSRQENPPIARLVSSGAIPVLVKYTEDVRNPPEVLFEALWIFTNIASTNFATKDVVADPKAITSIVRLLKHVDDNVRHQAMWCLGNVAGESRHDCLRLINEGIMEPIIVTVINPRTPEILAVTLWTLSNMCKYEPRPPELAPVVPHLVKTLMKICDSCENRSMDEIVADGVWALAYMMEGASTHTIGEILETGVAGTLVKLLRSEDNALLDPLVRCLASLVMGTDSQTQIILDAGLMDHIAPLLENSNREIQSYTCWMLSNIAAGTTEHIELLFKNRQAMIDITNLAYESHHQVQKQARWFVINVFRFGTFPQVRQYANNFNALGCLDGALDCWETGMMIAALDAINRILEAESGSYHVSYADQFYHHLDVTEKVEQLQAHENHQVYKKAVHILETYYG